MSRLLARALLFLSLFASPAFAGGPLAAVTEAQRAVDKADVNAFNAAVDVDAILQKGLDAALPLLCEQAASGKLAEADPILALALAGAASDCRPENPQLIILRGLVQSEAKTFVSAGVGGGYFAGRPNGRVSEDSAHSRLLRGMSKARKELVPGKLLSQQGDTAEASAVLRDAEAGEFPLRLKLERARDTWRVVEVLNAQDLARNAIQHRR